MAFSLGFSEKVINNPIYNLGFALPFVCAFYLMNTNVIYSLPFIGFSIGRDLSALLSIAIVSFFYFLSIAYIVIASYFSEHLNENKWFWVFPIFVIAASVRMLISADPEEPKIALLFGLHAVLVIFFHLISKENKEEISLATTQLLGAFLSITLFTSGILWYFGQPYFSGAVQSVLAVESVSKESRQVGGIMLFTLGYVCFYGVFKISELLAPSHS